MVFERLVSVYENDGYLLAVSPLQLRIGLDVDDPERERKTAMYPFNNMLRVITQMTTRPRVDINLNRTSHGVQSSRKPTKRIVVPGGHRGRSAREDHPASRTASHPGGDA